MNRLLIFEASVCLALSLLITGCERKVTALDSAAAGMGPVPAKVASDFDANNFKVDYPDRFPLRWHASTATPAKGQTSSP
jgi:hypothetical protein